LSWVRRHAHELGITPDAETQFLTDRDIHVHMPEGSIGKEGPSAGTALVSAFVSLFTNTKVNPDIGEFGLIGAGAVLRVKRSHDRRDIAGGPGATCRWTERKDTRGA
jgi:ATP-dependent Lon protease